MDKCLSQFAQSLSAVDHSKTMSRSTFGRDKLMLLVWMPFSDCILSVKSEDGEDHQVYLALLRLWMQTEQQTTSLEGIIPLYSAIPPNSSLWHFPSGLRLTCAFATKGVMFLHNIRV